MMWSLVGGPETLESGTDGYDGDWHKWWMEQDGRRVFTVVKISRHAAEGLHGELLTSRSRAAVNSRGRSEVERHLVSEIPPRVVEIRTVGEPVTTHRE